MSKETFSYYTELFNTPTGKLVLEDLQQIWKSAPAGLEASALAHLEGQRHVLRYIESSIQKGLKVQE